MSANEVIEEIKKLPPEEQQKIAAFLREISVSNAPVKSDAKVSETFERVANEVFTTNAELFRKLAQ